MCADEEEPLIEVEGAPCGMLEADGAAVGALDAWTEGVERGARLTQARERVCEREAGGANALGRFEFDAACALDELLDGDGVERLGCRARARLLGLTQQLIEQPDDVALDNREMFDQLCDRPAVGRGAESLLLFAQALDGREQPRARAVDVFVDFGDAAEVHKERSLLL